MWSESSCAFAKNGTATGESARRERSERALGESARAMADPARQKRLYLHHQGEFENQNCTLGSLHDSDDDGVVRIFVGHS